MSDVEFAICAGRCSVGGGGGRARRKRCLTSEKPPLSVFFSFGFDGDEHCSDGCSSQTFGSCLHTVAHKFPSRSRTSAV